MEHDFIYLADSRRYLLKLPSEQHALQCFLLEEFDLYARSYQSLADKLSTLGPYDEYQFAGREYSLHVERMEVRVFHHSCGQIQPDDQFIEADLNTDDASLQSECGVEDLLRLLQAWQQFLPA